MQGMYHPLHLLLLYTGMVLMFASIGINRYQAVTFTAEFALAVTGLGYYWWRAIRSHQVPD